MRNGIVAGGAIFLVAIAVRAWAAAVLDFPRPEDTAYYVGVARALVEGRGLVSNAIWSYGTPPLVFPRPAFEVWLPLPTFLAAIPMAILGTTFAAAQWSSIVVGAVVVVLAARLAADVAEERGLPPGRARTLVIGTGLAASVYLPLVLHSVEPDSTMPFAAIVLGACGLATRIVRSPAGGRATDRRVLALGLLLGLGAWTRNEAIWLALAWAVVAWRASGGDRRAWFRLVGGAAVPAILVFAPWAVRDWLVFGNPFPGQALSNALSLDGRDIFAWQDPPTLSAYLDAGIGTLMALRWTAVLHNLVSVLVLLGVPVSVIGLVGLPWLGRLGRGPALSMLVAFSLITFIATTLLFPVATIWGTYLHASAATQVLLLISALLALDRFIAAVGARRGWTRPVAWLGPFLAVTAGLLFTAVVLPTAGRDGALVRDRFAALPGALAAAGIPLEPVAAGGGAGTAPVITDTPIWLAEETGVRALALPDEPPSSVLDLAAHFPGTSLVIVAADDEGIWPEVLSSGAPGAACFEPVALGSDPALADVRVFRIACP